MLLTKALNTGLSALAILLAVILATSAHAETRMQDAIQRQVADQLAGFKTTAYELSREADTLSSTTPLHQLSWQAHSNRLGILKDHVNQLGSTLAELEALKPQANDSQKMAIEHVRPHLVAVAQHLTLAIELVNENSNNIHSPEYGERVSTIYAHADALYSKLDAILDHQNVNMRLEALELQARSTEED
jgi:hypothetical protein